MHKNTVKNEIANAQQILKEFIEYAYEAGLANDETIGSFENSEDSYAEVTVNVERVTQSVRDLEKSLNIIAAVIEAM